MDLNVHVDGLDAFVRKFNRAPQIISEEMGKAGTRAGLLVEREAKRLAPVWRGQLRRSITSKTTVSPMAVTTTVGTNVTYARAVEFGRRAGATQPPSGPIAAWLASKGIDAPAYVVARAIGQRGIPARPFLRKAFDALMARIQGEFRKVPAAVIARLKGGG